MRSAGRRWWRAATRATGGADLLCIAVLLASCGPSSPADRAKKEAQTLISSAATVRMVAGAWLSGAVPDAFASKTLQTVEQSLQKESQQLGGQQLPPGARATLLKAAQSVHEDAGAIRVAVQRHSRPEFARHLDRLAQTEQVLLHLERASAAP